MNELFYPHHVVENAADQLDMLPAPDKHPVVDGKPVSAFHPLAMNAHNIGGFTRSPRMEGKRVITDLVIDLDVANKSQRGKKIISNIRNGKRIGVSTGLVADINNACGSVGDKKFNGKVESMQFDHVALLLDEPPAGDNTYTINHDSKTTRVFNMDRLELDLSPLAIKDRVALQSLTVNELLQAVNAETSIEDAKAVIEKAGLHIHNCAEDDVNLYLNNRADFEAWQKQKNDEIAETRKFILDNSKMTAADLQGMSEATLNSLAKSVAPKNTYIAPDGQRKTPELELLEDC